MSSEHADGCRFKRHKPYHVVCPSPLGPAVPQCAATASPSMAKHNCKEQKNRVVSQGLQLPLEVFKTSNGRGWGVRCSSDIPIGTFVCDYVGKLLTDSEAVSRVS